MTLVALAACLTLLGYLAGVGAGTPLALLLLRTGRGASDPEALSRRLLALRLLPLGVGIVLAFGLVLPAFVWLEPSPSGERVGAKLALAAIAAAGVLVAGSARGLLDVLATRRLVRRWTRSARPVRMPGMSIPAFSLDERFPIVAIVGWIRPRLYVSSEVLRRCTKAELAAIVAHESAHLRRGDPWTRVLVRACPDLLALTPLGAAIERRWAEASERAADDLAAATGRERPVELASALVRVARLAGAARPRALPVTALYRGGGVADRVSRLLAASEAPGPRPRSRRLCAPTVLLAAGAAVAPAAAALGALYPVHRLLEAVVVLLG